MKKYNFRTFLSTSLALAMTAGLLVPTGALSIKDPEVTYVEDVVFLDSTESSQNTLIQELFPSKKATDSFTYGELAVVLRHLIGFDEESYVTKNSHYWDYERESVEMMKVLGGYNSFSIKNTVTREQFAIEVAMTVGGHISWMMDPSYMEYWEDNRPVYDDFKEFTQQGLQAVSALNYYDVLMTESEEFRPKDAITVEELSSLIPQLEEFYLYGRPTLWDQYEEFDVAEFDDLQQISYLYDILSSTIQKNSRAILGETITWNSKEGGLTSSETKDGIKSTLLQQVQWELSTHPDVLGVASSSWGQDFVASFTVSEYYGDYFLYTENEDLAYTFALPINPEGTEHISENPEIDAFFEALYPSDIELYGDDLWEQDDVSAVNELTKASLIAVSLCSPSELDMDLTEIKITWHSNAKDGIYISTNESEDKSPIQDEIYYMLGNYGEYLGAGRTPWATDEDIVLSVGVNADNFDSPFIYCENESVAYRLNISKSSNINDNPTSDPRPMDENGETKREYYELMEDGNVFGELFTNFLKLAISADDVSETESITWNTKTGTLEVVSDENSPLQQLVAEYQEKMQVAYCPLWGDSVTLQVGVDEEGNKFPYSTNEFSAYVMGIPKSSVSDDYVTDYDGPFWLPTTTAGSWSNILLQEDASKANEVVKMVVISMSITEEIPPAGTSILWDSCDTGEVIISGEGSEAFQETFFAFFPEGVYPGLGSCSPLISQPLEFKIGIHTDGEVLIPFVYCEDITWAAILNIASNSEGTQDF